ncbi:MAG: NADH-quinone oxidoreductase subunit J [Polyangiaceae bacterium]
MRNLEIAFFGLCTLLVLIGGVFTVAAKNPIRGAMGLLSTILGIAGMYLLLSAELLAAIQVTVYAGAVVVLFLFVIMLIGPTNTGSADARGAVGRYVGAGGFAVVAVGLLWIITRLGGKTLTRLPPPSPDMGTVERIGREMFTDQVVVFEVSGILLLIAVVGAMAVARGKSGTQMSLPQSGERDKSNASRETVKEGGHA